MDIMLMTLLLFTMLLLPFAGSLLASILPRKAKKTTSILTCGVALAGLACAVALFPAVADGGLTHDIEWLPSLGLNVVLRLNGLSWIFSILVLGIGALVALYTHYYMSPQDPVPRFYSYFLAFMGSMLGLIMSGNL